MEVITKKTWYKIYIKLQVGHIGESFFNSIFVPRCTNIPTTSRTKIFIKKCIVQLHHIILGNVDHPQQRLIIRLLAILLR